MGKVCKDAGLCTGQGGYMRDMAWIGENAQVAGATQTWCTGGEDLILWENWEERLQMGTTIGCRCDPTAQHSDHNRMTAEGGGMGKTLRNDRNYHSFGTVIILNGHYNRLRTTCVLKVYGHILLVLQH